MRFLLLNQFDPPDAEFARHYFLRSAACARFIELLENTTGAAGGSKSKLS